MNNNLVLISPFYPEAGFSPGNAMQRNKYIYCLSDSAIAVHSGTKGGTWNGAIENINKQWVPLWVKETQDSEAGNAQLVAKGARWLPQSIDDFTVDGLLIDLPSNPAREAKDSPLSQNLSTREPVSDYQPEETLVEQEGPIKLQDASFYGLFLLKIQTLCWQQALGIDELMTATDLHKSQLTAWLKQAVEEGKVNKLNRPVRYQWAENKQQDFLN